MPTKKKTAKQTKAKTGLKKRASAKGTAGKQKADREPAAEAPSQTRNGQAKAAKKPFRLTETTKRKLIRDLIATIGTRIQNKKEDVGSIADLTRLLQLEKDMGPKRPRNITVVWEKPKDR